MINKLSRLRNKEFRDAYVSSHLTQGLAYQIRALRMQRGWSQADLANKLGVKGQSTVARIEDPSYGKLSISTLLKLSSIFDVTLSVKFLSYGKFLLERDDLSPHALSAESFESELPKLVEGLDYIAGYQKIALVDNDDNDTYDSYQQISVTKNFNVINFKSNIECNHDH